MCHGDDSRAPEPPRRAPVGPHAELILTSTDGSAFRAYSAAPSARPGAGVVILPDVRGLHPFYEDLAVRFAEAGFLAIAVDYYGRTVGTGPRDDSFDWKSQLDKVTPEGIARDVGTAVDRLRSVSKDGVFPSSPSGSASEAPIPGVSQETTPPWPGASGSTGGVRCSAPATRSRR